MQYQIINSQINGAIAAVDGKELWRLNVRNVKQEQIESLNAPEKCRYALGPDIPFELLAVRPWTGHCVVADNYQKARIPRRRCRASELAGRRLRHEHRHRRRRGYRLEACSHAPRMGRRTIC